MIYFVVEVDTKWRGHDYERLDVIREEFNEALSYIKNLFLFPFEIETIYLKQYSYNGYRTTLLNCFNVYFMGNNFISEPIFEYDDVSSCL